LEKCLNKICGFCFRFVEAPVPYPSLNPAVFFDIFFIHLFATNPLQGHKTHQDIDIVQCHNIKYN
jgi:hypothetical protein